MRTVGAIVIWLALPLAAWWLVLVGGGWAAVALVAAFALCIIAVAAIASLFERRTWRRMREPDHWVELEVPVWTRPVLYDHEAAGDFR